MPLQNYDPNACPGYGWAPSRRPSPYVRVLLLYLEATENWNYDAIMPLFDDSLQHWSLPASLGRPLLNKRQYGEYIRVVRPMFKKFKVTVNEVIEAENKLCVHAFLHAESLKGTPLDNEYFITFHFIPKSPMDDADALPKICLVKEFIDSAASNKFFLAEKTPKDADTNGSGRK